MQISGVPQLQVIHKECVYMIISDTSCMIGVFTIALLTAEFGQVLAEHVCHDIMPQLWRRLEGKRSIQGDNCNKDVMSR